jgi:hypothetical protein
MPLLNGGVFYFYNNTEKSSDFIDAPGRSEFFEVEHLIKKTKVKNKRSFAKIS